MLKRGKFIGKSRNKVTSQPGQPDSLNEQSGELFYTLVIEYKDDPARYNKRSLVFLFDEEQTVKNATVFDSKTREEHRRTWGH